MNDNIDRIPIQVRQWEGPNYGQAFTDCSCTIYDRIRISHFLPKFREQLWIECADNITIAAQAVMDFAHAVGVYSLVQEDTNVLLRKGAFEVIAICISSYIAPSTNYCLLFGKTSLPERTFCTMDMEERDLVSSISNFAKDIAHLKLTPDQLGAYSALVLYNDESPGLRFPNEVKEKKNSILLELKLRLYFHNGQPLENGVTVFDALIAKIPELRLIGFMYRNAVAKFRQSHPHIELPRLHEELFGFVALRATAA